jgi:Holliday junction resolvasome RuvABC endonuclease subunit
MSKKKAPVGPSLFGSQDDEDPFGEAVIAPPVTRNKRDVGLLALDLATATGYCVFDGSGVWRFTTKPKIDKSYKLVFLHQRLKEICEAKKIRRIVYEEPLIYKSKEKKRRPNFVSFEMLGIVKFFCLNNNIRFGGYYSGTIKKFATGNGHAQKEEMTGAAISMYQVMPDDHNEADALHLYHLAIEDLQL